MANDVIVTAEDFEAMVLLSTVVRSITEHEPGFAEQFMAIAESIPDELLEKNMEALRKGTV